MKKKLLVIASSEAGKGIISIISNTLKDKGLANKMEVCLYKEAAYKILRGYDAHLIHLSDVGEKDLELLRCEQSWSWIYALTGVNISSIEQSIKRNADRVYNLISQKQAEEIIWDLQRGWREGSEHD